MTSLLCNVGHKAATALMNKNEENRADTHSSMPLLSARLIKGFRKTLGSVKLLVTVGLDGAEHEVIVHLTKQVKILRDVDGSITCSVPVPHHNGLKGGDSKVSVKLIVCRVSGTKNIRVKHFETGSSDCSEDKSNMLSWNHGDVFRNLAIEARLASLPLRNNLCLLDESLRTFVHILVRFLHLHNDGLHMGFHVVDIIEPFVIVVNVVVCRPKDSICGKQTTCHSDVALESPL